MMNSSESRPESNQRFCPITLTSQNFNRRHFLPCFPPSNDNENPHLLFSNVPVESLASYQYRRRYKQSSVDTHAFRFIETDDDTPSFIIYIYRKLFLDFSQRCKIDQDLIDYNLTRLDECLCLLAIDSNVQYWTSKQQEQGYQTSFTIDEWPMALEFFLQMDVDLFFLKTCSFRGASPRTTFEGIFCIDQPIARYGMMQCGRSSLICRCCRNYSHSIVDKTDQSTLVGVTFTSSQCHRFVNNYRAILNCPVTCTTSNIIYVLTCSCHQFDYVGETTISFCDRLSWHHHHVTRIIHEFLIGKINVDQTRNAPKSVETLAKDGMRLYRHCTLCSKAMQLFLNHNPTYWCFIPMKLSESNHQDNTMTSSSNDIYLSNSTRTDDEAQSFIDNLPTPLSGYHFSNRQKHEQFLFFKNKIDLVPISTNFDLYHAAIVIVLPIDCSELLRRFVESLLIIHTESKLNTAGHLTNYDPDYRLQSNRNPLTHGLWLDGVTHPACYLK